MQLVVTDAGGRAVAALEDFSLDMSIGDGGNDFELSLPDTAPRLGAGCMCYSPGTDWGGVVDSVSSETKRTGPVLKYSGRTWSGVLANRVVLPPSGQGYYVSRGEANACIRELIGSLGLSGAFSTPMADSGVEVDFQWPRFCDAWSGLLECLRASSARPSMRWSGGAVEISAVPARTYGMRPGEDVSIRVDRDYRPVNHLVCAGTGELANRAVVHFYADESGNVSHVQSLFGIDEVSALYDYTNASESELETEGAKKLADYQVEGAVECSVLDESVRLGVGDSIAGREDRFGIEVTSRIVSKVATVKAGVEKVEYGCGQASTTRSLSATSESSGGGGASYTAGEGITISGGVISADVTESDIGSLESRVEDAVKTASDASAAAGAAQQAAESAQRSADAAQETADGKADASHTHTVAQITDFPDSMPASDVRAWAKADEKPSYTAEEVGAAPAVHEHRYAGSDTAGGAASEALRLSERRVITFTGAVSGTLAFDGSSDETVTLVGDLGSAGFLDAHPVGSYFETSSDADPSDIGGSWEFIEAVGRARLWHRTE